MIERDYGGPMGWERLDDKRACRIKAEVDERMGSEEDWPKLQDALISAMIRFEKAVKPFLETLPH